MNRRTKSILLSFSLIIVGSMGIGNLNADDLPPNVLFLAVDDMNDWIGCLETTPRAITPNINQLAQRGVL